MGRFENRQLVKLRTNTIRVGRCTILRGNDSWIVRHRKRHVGAKDTLVEAEMLAHQETGRLDTERQREEDEAAERQYERQAEQAAEAAHVGDRVVGFDADGSPAYASDDEFAVAQAISRKAYCDEVEQAHYEE